MNQEGHLFAVMIFPHPWPPANTCLLAGGEANGLPFEVLALTDGRIQVKTPSATTSFISQPVDLGSDPQWVLLELTLSPSESELLLSGQLLLKDAPGSARFLLNPIKGLVRPEFAINHPDATVACQQWIQKRKAKFAQPYRVQPDRRAKTIEEQAHDLRNSIHRLRYLEHQTLAGHKYLLGTLAGEMRAAVYWKKDAQRDFTYSPLLLRMANLADLPLPVYSVPKTVEIPPILSLQVAYEPGASAPRIVRMFDSDRLCDLQESLTMTVLQLGQSPARTVTSLKLITELAHTMGAAHYDEEASEFLDVLHKLQGPEGDHVTVLMCETAAVIASLSEWVLSELKKRNMIS